MFFKNLLVYRLPAGFFMTAYGLESLLEERRLRPPNEASMESIGWSAAGPHGELVYGLERNLLLTLGRGKRIIPGAVVKQVLAERTAELEKQQGFAPGRKQLRDLKERILDELRPKAFIQYSYLRAWIDQTAGLLMVETTSAKQAEMLITSLISTLGSFAAEPVTFRMSPSTEMSRWLLQEDVPAGLEVTYETELVTPGQEDKPTVRYMRHEVAGRDDVIQHLKEGKLVTKLGLVHGSTISFLLTHTFQICKLRFESLDSEAKSPADFDGSLTLMVGEYRKLIAALFDAFHAIPSDLGEDADGEDDESSHGIDEEPVGANRGALGAGASAEESVPDDICEDVT